MRTAQVDTFPFHLRRRTAFQALPWHGGASDGFHYPPAGIGTGIGIGAVTGIGNETGSGGSHHPRAKSGVRPRNRHRMLSLAQDASTRTRRKNKNCLSCKTFSKLRQIPQASTCIRAYRKNPAADSELQRDFSARQEFPVPICGKQAFRRRQGVRLTKSSRPRTPAACPPEP